MARMTKAERLAAEEAERVAQEERSKVDYASRLPNLLVDYSRLGGKMRVSTLPDGSLTYVLDWDLVSVPGVCLTEDDDRCPVGHERVKLIPFEYNGWASTCALNTLEDSIAAVNRYIVAQAEIAQAKKVALDKLTPEERKLLGV